MRLKRKFFNRGAEIVAKELLGKTLVRRFGNGHEVRGVITETEAYVGERDLASHAKAGRTKRTEAMYGDPGTVYMFFTYGVHWMFNIVCSRVGDPQAVLVRGLDIVSGPGRLTKLLELDKSFYGENLETSNRLWVEPPTTKSEYGEDYTVVVTPRIGIDYAKEWRDKPLRFVLKR